MVPDFLIIIITGAAERLTVREGLAFNAGGPGGSLLLAFGGFGGPPPRNF